MALQAYISQFYIHNELLTIKWETLQIIRIRNLGIETWIQTLCKHLLHN